MSEQKTPARETIDLSQPQFTVFYARSLQSRIVGAVSRALDDVRPEYGCDTLNQLVRDVEQAIMPDDKEKDQFLIEAYRLITTAYSICSRRLEDYYRGELRSAQNAIETLQAENRAYPEIKRKLQDIAALVKSIDLSDKKPGR